ncbi:MAG: glutamate racemase [Candidatus Omnitrophica bacterium]|nr:glutamate racemase [Candidatus Omnitrophota bacterium]
MSSQPIGIFDSGLGGLTVVRELRRQLPNESIVYFGDIARLPYGTKSRSQIQRFSLENTQFLLQKGIKALVIACNSSSSAAFQLLKRRFPIPMVSVVEPAVGEALQRTKAGKVGVIGTPATIESRVYEEALRRGNSRIEVFAQSCPLFVPLVEEGWLNGGVAERVIQKYLTPLAEKKIDTLILGCTHYPLLREEIQGFFGPKVQLIDSASPTVKQLASFLERKKLLYEGRKNARFQIFTSDLPRNFIHVGERFLGEPLPPIKVVR